MATLVQEARCRVCRGYGVFVEVTLDGYEVTVAAHCYACDHDYGTIGNAYIPGVGEDEAHEAGTALVEERLG